MKNKKIMLQKFKEKVAKDKELRKDIRYKNVMGFLTGRGFLFTNQNIVAQPKKRIDIKDYLWVGDHLEPRVLELLPAVILRFPMYVENQKDAPEALIKVLVRIKELNETGPDFKGILYEKMRGWAYLDLQDKRTKSLDKKKILKSFRLSPDTISKLSKIAKSKKVSLTEALELSVASA